MEYVYSHPYLSLIQMAFTIWMLVDAYRRRAENFWYYVILLGQAVGALVYFFAVLLPELRRRARGQPWFQRRETIAELQYRVNETPTLANHLALARRLMEKGRHAEAEPHLTAALKREPDHATALHCLATCHLTAGRPAEAVPLLERVIARDARWSDYAAWHTLVEAKSAAGDSAGAVDRCRDLVRLAPTMHHHCLLAEQLVACDRPDEARGLLDKCLQDHAYAPAPARRRDRRWAGEAKRLQKQVSGPR